MGREDLNVLDSLELFNVVPKKKDKKIKVSYDQGILVDSSASWAAGKIFNFYKKKKLSGNDLNKSFYKSWNQLLEKTTEERIEDQVLHYLSTYGSDFEDEVYIPEHISNVPEVRVIFKVVKGVSEQEIKSRTLELLTSGVALKQETMIRCVNLLTRLDYKFTGNEGIKNKEAIIHLATTKGIIPKDPVDALRYALYKATESTLLIKSRTAIEQVSSIPVMFNKIADHVGVEEFAKIFNRYKPLFLAFKRADPKCRKHVNRISKLSKKLHTPMVQNPLNTATSRKIKKGDEHWLKNATIFSLFKAYAACQTYMSGISKRSFQIRNGKSWVTNKPPKADVGILYHNHKKILDEIKDRVDLSDEKIYIPDNVVYALPTSEKMFVGNVPVGTVIKSKELSVGVYWQNDWGARDIDLSAMSVSGHKVGWNGGYTSNSDNIRYSGDITDATNGAVEYISVSGKVDTNMVVSNVYSGNHDCGYKIIVGDSADVDYNYMMDPNKVMLDEKCQSIKKETILGLVKHDGTEARFTILNIGAQSKNVSGYDDVSSNYRDALVDKWDVMPTLNELLEILGASIVNKESGSTIDLSLEKLDKDKIIKIFKAKE